MVAFYGTALQFLEVQMQKLKNEIESGLVGINSIAMGYPEQPFGGVKDSGFASEGGADALAFYLSSKFVSQTI